MIQIESNNELVVDRKLLVDMVDAIIEGIERGCTRKEIVCQLDLILDKESQKAIERGMQEHREGKTKRFSDVKKLIAYLNK
ncbi:MAG: hypothetical protein HMLIMOIP_001811 [Candidatus Nitrosomirales archaeon]|jgi:hypothetical protein